MSSPDGSARPSLPSSAPLPPTYDDTGKFLDVGGGYRLVTRLGEGAFGEVWKAEAPGGVLVAIKIIPRTLKKEEAQRELEALELIKKLRHQNLLSLQAYFSLEDKLVIVLELADGDLGGRLKECLATGQPGIPPTELLRYMREAAEALDYLHNNQVQHRDIKPANILLLGSHVKVADFSLARVVDQRSLHSATSVGTPLYMAPEMCNGKISMHSDQYSLSLMYAELRGRYPYPQDNVGQIVYAHMHGTPDLDHLGKHEQQALLRGMAKDPGQRHGSCTELVRALVQAMIDDGASSKQGRTAPVSGLPPANKGKAREVARTLTKAPPVAKPAQKKTDSATLADLGQLRPSGPAVKRGSRDAWSRAGWLGIAGLIACAVIVLIVVIVKVVQTPPTKQDGAASAGSEKGNDQKAEKATKQKLQQPPAKEQVKDDKGEAKAPVKAADEERKKVEVRIPAAQAATYTAELGGGIKMEFVRIDGGEFDMGSAEGSASEQPRHKVQFGRPFWMAKYKTTQAQFAKVVERKPSYFAETGGGKDKVAGLDTSQFPVDTVTWFDAIDFCNKLSVRENRRPCYELSGIQKDINGSITSAEVKVLRDGNGYRLPSEAEWEDCARGNERRHKGREVLVWR
jgi:serine/threonine protein kinase